MSSLLRSHIRSILNEIDLNALRDAAKSKSATDAPSTKKEGSKKNPAEALIDHLTKLNERDTNGESGWEKSVAVTGQDDVQRPTIDDVRKEVQNFLQRLQLRGG